MLLKVTSHGSANFVVTQLDANLQDGDIIANAISPWSGIVPLDFGGASTTKIKVESDGPFTMQVLDLRYAHRLNGTATGSGDDVLYYTGSPAVLTYTLQGDSNVTGEFYADPTGDNDIVINEIAPANGSGTIPGGPGYLVLTGPTTWTLTAKP
jgi:hypothetical protein